MRISNKKLDQLFAYQLRFLLMQKIARLNKYFLFKVEQDTRNDVVFDVKTSIFTSTTMDGCISK